MRAGRDAYAMLAVPMAVLLVFTLVPTALGIGLSLFRWNGGGAPVWVGLDNYLELLRDARFGPALRNTLLFTLATAPLTVLGAFALSLAVHAEWFRGRAVVRAMLFVPTIVSTAAIGFIWRWVFSDQSGLLNWCLSGAGVNDPPRWLNQGWWPLFAIILVGIWRQVGFCVLIYLSALASIDRSLHEAAALDGAGRAKVVRHITWPGVRGATLFLLVTQTFTALQVFDLVFVLTAGQETASTTMLNIEVYRKFTFGLMGPSAAIGMVILVLMLPAAAWQARGASPRARGGR